VRTSVSFACVARANKFWLLVRAMALKTHSDATQGNGSEQPHLPEHTARLVRPPSSRPNESRCVAVIHEDVSPMLACMLAYAVQRRDVSIHREDAVCCNQLDARITSSYELLFKVCHVHVVVP
jgi:hypothetical protein